MCQLHPTELAGSSCPALDLHQSHPQSARRHGGTCAWGPGALGRGRCQARWTVDGSRVTLNTSDFTLALQTEGLYSGSAAWRDMACFNPERAGCKLGSVAESDRSSRLPASRAWKELDVS